jgi:uncharacterized membrane protein
MRGIVMIFMIIDHASMAFNNNHIYQDSALYEVASTMALPAFAFFFTRWITHLSAPAFVALAGTALALSIDKKVAKGVNAWEIDKGILIRGAIIVLLDLTVISFGSGRWTFQVLFAIGLSMICMAFLRRFPTWVLTALSLSWIVFGEIPTGLVWQPPGSSSPISALFIATYGSEDLVIKYPLFPWLAMMILGWVFGRHINKFAAGLTNLSPKKMMFVSGLIGIAVFITVRGLHGYGDMFFPRTGTSWQQWLHVSKYPPSLSFCGLELGLLGFCLSSLMTIEPKLGVRSNGILLVFGQTAMFFYLLHRLLFEIPATYFGLRGGGNISTTYFVSAAMIIPLYYACVWYRKLKASSPESFLKYF